MSNLITFDDQEATGKINIDELYEKNMKRNLKQISIFNKILNRIHRRIMLSSRTTRNDKYIWPCASSATASSASCTAASKHTPPTT